MSTATLAAPIVSPRRPVRERKARPVQLQIMFTQAEVDCLEMLVALERSPSRSHTVRLLALDQFRARGIRGTEPTDGPRRPRRKDRRDPRTEPIYTTFSNDEIARLEVLSALTASPTLPYTLRELVLDAFKAKGITIPAAEEDTTNSRGQLAA